MMAAAQVACLNHVSRESTDIKRLAQFYIEIFGFEQIESPKFEFEVIWLKLGSSLYLHLIERDTSTKLPEGPWSATSAVADPKNLPRGHHVCFSVPNFDSFVQNLKVAEGQYKDLKKWSVTMYLEIDDVIWSFIFGNEETKDDKGINVHERMQPDGMTKQAFFFDPDGNGLEVSSKFPVE